MSEVDEFLSNTMPRLISAERALHNGNAAPRLAMWSQNDPVTLFGAWLSDSGWEDVSHTFEVLASRFSECDAYEVNLLAAGASGDLAYTVAYENVTVSIESAPRSYTLRVTQIYRREDEDWKLVHRHGDEVAESQERLNMKPAH
jgi:ketosteroid isomerase-like protein